jgi:hypothetical protein
LQLLAAQMRRAVRASMAIRIRPPGLPGSAFEFGRR